MPLLCRLLVVLLTPVLLLASQATAHAEGPGDRVTFGLGPGGTLLADTRSALSFAAAPGSTLRDDVAVYNQSDVPLDLLVYATDARNTDVGTIDLLPRATPNADLGSWIALGAAALTGEAPGNRDLIRVRVPAQSRTKGVGRVLLPINLVIPANATPGDHAAGIVAGLLSKGTNPGSQNIELEQRVALRINLRVAGEITPALSVEVLKAEYLGGAGLGLKGTTRVQYLIRNTGNVRLGAATGVRVNSWLGLGSTFVQGASPPELVPGGTAKVQVDVPDTPPSLRQTVTVNARAKAAVNGPAVEATPVSDQISIWAVTWQEVVLLLVLLLLLGLWLVRRRRKGRPGAPGSPRRRRGRHAVSSEHDAADTLVKAGVVTSAALLLLLVLPGALTGKALAATTLGSPAIRPAVGSSETLFFGFVKAACPAGTLDSYWTIDGPGLPQDTAFLAPGNASGTGPQQFRNASIANLRTVNTGAFSQDGTYTIRFRCVGRSVADYAVPLRWRAAGKGRWTVTSPGKVPDYVIIQSLPQPTQPPAAAPVTSPAPGRTSPGAAATGGPAASPTTGSAGGSANGSTSGSADGTTTGTPPSSDLAGGQRERDDGPSAAWWLLALLALPLGVAARRLRNR